MMILLQACLERHPDTLHSPNRPRGSTTNAKCFQYATFKHKCTPLPARAVNVAIALIKEMEGPSEESDDEELATLRASFWQALGSVDLVSPSPATPADDTVPMTLLKLLPALCSRIRFSITQCLAELMLQLTS